MSFEPAMQPLGGKAPAAPRPHDLLMNETPGYEADGTARPSVSASSFRALQEKLRTVRARTSGPAVRPGEPPVIPDLPIEPEMAPAEVAPPVEAEPRPVEAEAALYASPDGAEESTESELEPDTVPPNSEDLLRPLVEKFSGTAALLKKIEPAVDPFSEISAGVGRETPEAGEEPATTGLIDPQSGDVARSLLDVMSAPPGRSQPQERALAADTLLRLVPHLPLKSLAGLVQRVSLMEAPPQLLVRRLIRDARIEIAGPLLERASAISDQELMMVIAQGDAAKQRLIARRRAISPALSEALIEIGDAGALLTLVRNPGATFSIESFHRLGELAAEMPALQAPLSTRLDTPAPVAFELFWALPAELRRYVLSRFLTDSEPRFPDKAMIDEFVELARDGDLNAAAARLAELAGISRVNADRIMADREGEPISVVLEALGLSRARFAEVIDEFRRSPQEFLRGSRNISELQSIFDSLSFNKARMLLTYWDWAVQHSGPYARNGK